jgi:hypothetical protein
MGFQVKSVNACTIISMNARSFTGANSANVIFKNLDTGSIYTQVLNYSGANLAGQANVLVSNLPTSNGVYEVSLQEGGVEVAKRPLILHCDIDCCLSKLTNELIDCACDCPKCSSALAKAQKIFLLLQSALSSRDLATTPIGSMNSGYYQDILQKYLKAKSICDNSCGCNC